MLLTAVRAKRARLVSAGWVRVSGTVAVVEGTVACHHPPACLSTSPAPNLLASLKPCGLRCTAADTTQPHQMTDTRFKAIFQQQQTPGMLHPVYTCVAGVAGPHRHTQCSRQARTQTQVSRGAPVLQLPAPRRCRCAQVCLPRWHWWVNRGQTHRCHPAAPTTPR